MQKVPIIEQIKAFYKRYPLLSQIMLANLIVLIFLRENIFSIVYYVYITYFAGKLLFDFLNNRKLFTIYIYGAIAGIFIYLIFLVPAIGFNYKAFLSVAVASGVMALLAAIGTYLPNMELMLFIAGKVKLKWVVIVLIILDIFTRNPLYENAEIAHLGGVILGFLSIYLMKQSFFNNSFSSWFYKSKSKQKLRKVKPDKNGRPLTDEEYNVNKAIDQAEIDAILDKISKSGYESLSKAEKEKLFRISNKK